MDILKIQFKPGTYVKDLESGETLQVSHFSGHYVYFTRVNDSDVFRDNTFDYYHYLGKRYIKDKTAQVLYGR